jgi:hypothetical protein
MRRIDDGDPFNAGWNAALEEADKRVRKMPTEAVKDHRTLIAKADVLGLLNDHVGER